MSATATQEAPETVAPTDTETNGVQEKKKKGKKEEGAMAKVSDEKVHLIDIHDIKSNVSNNRYPLERLQDLGFGIFAVEPNSDKPAMVPMALSDKPEERAEYCRLIENYECALPPVPGETEADRKKRVNLRGGLLDMVDSIEREGLLEPCEVRPLEDGAGYDLVFGARRTMAILYLHCKSGRPARIVSFVKISDDDRARNRSDDENNGGRKDPSPMDRSRRYLKLKQQGRTVDEIAALTGKNKQTIQGHLDLQKLRAEEQVKVHNGEIPYSKARKLLEERKTNPGALPTAAHLNKNKTGRAKKGSGQGKFPTRSQVLTWLGKGKEEPRELPEKVREFLFLEFVDLPYQTMSEIRKERKEAEEKAAK